MAKDKILLTIAARGGSKGVKNKNIRPLCGLPLIAYTIRQARQWGRADRVICSTDSPEIARVAKEYGAEVPFMRPAELADDLTGKPEVIRHALGEMEKISGEKYEVIVDLDVTAPIRKIEDIEGSYRMFLKRRPKSVFSVTPCRRNPYFNMVEIGSDGWAELVKKPGAPLKRRQDAPRVFDANASIYFYDREFLLDSNMQSVLSDRTSVYIMDEWSAFDIDNESDFQFVEFLVSKGIVSL